MPMLASTSRITPSTSKGWCRAWRSRSATASASPTPSTDGSRTANSSPPRRADRVRLPQDRPQPRAHLAQQLVAVGVPEGVVDLLEAVQVDEQERDLGLGAGGHGETLVEAVLDQDPVGQPGQRVVRGLVPVAVGGGLQRLGLATQALRRRRDEAEDDDVEAGEADRPARGSWSGRRRARRRPPARTAGTARWRRRDGPRRRTAGARRPRAAGASPSSLPALSSAECAKPETT